MYNIGFPVIINRVIAFGKFYKLTDGFCPFFPSIIKVKYCNDRFAFICFNYMFILTEV